VGVGVMSKIIDDDGVEYIILEERAPKKGEFYFDGHIRRATYDCSSSLRVWIIKKPPFRAKTNQNYWYVDLADEVRVVSRPELGCFIDLRLYKLGNYFETVAQAQAAVTKINSIFKETLNV
jgi:hypothetical protein